MDVPRRHCYALACAIPVRVADLLKTAHELSGGPVALEVSDAASSPLRTAMATTFGAAAATMSLSAHVLLIERDRLCPPVHQSSAYGYGGTMSSPRPPEWGSALSAVRVATDELIRARASWQAVVDTPTGEVVDAIENLSRYVDDLGAAIESAERARDPIV